MFSFHCADSGQLFTAAAALSAALAQGKTPDELARLAAFFPLVGDSLALFTLQPEGPGSCPGTADPTSQDTP